MLKNFKLLDDTKRLLNFNPNRQSQQAAILKTLAEKKECICGDLVLNLPLAQSTVSQHLKALKDIGLVKGTIDGPRSRYCIDWKVFDRYQRKLSDWSETISKLRQDNCC